MDFDDNYSDSEASSETQSLRAPAPPLQKWNQFRELPPQIDTGGAVKSEFWIKSERWLKAFTYVVTFVIVFGSSIVSKGSIIFMIKQLSANPDNLAFCNADSRGSPFIPSNSSNDKFQVDFSCEGDQDPEECLQGLVTEKVAWLWAIAFAFSFSQVGAFLRSLRKWLFKFTSFPKVSHFLFVLVMEVLHTVGLAMLCYMVMPHMDSVSALLLTSSLATVPALLSLLSRFKYKENDERETDISWIGVCLDVVAVLVQVSGALIWCLFHYLDINQDTVTPHPHPWAVPVAVILTSCGWWETFTEEESITWLGQVLWDIKNQMISGSNNKPATRDRMYTIITPLKLLTFYVSMVLMAWQTGIVDHPSQLTDLFEKSFGNHTYRVSSIQLDTVGGNQTEDGRMDKLLFILFDSTYHPVWLLIVQIAASYIAYISSKFACKVWIQTFSFAFPILMVLPFTLTFLVTMCAARATDECAFEGSAFHIPNRLFFECPATGDFWNYLWFSNTWFAIIWFLSYVWINSHIWFCESVKLASSEQIFGTPWYEGLFIDQSLVMNRRRDGSKKISVDDYDDDYNEEAIMRAEYTRFDDMGSKKSSIRSSDRVTRIYACATMWREEEDEMMEMLKSIFRVDSDYSARRLSRKYFDIMDPDYYEWESHIFFDNVFEEDKEGVMGEKGEKIVNKFVRQLVRLIDVAGSRHHKRPIKVKPCTKYPTPYGGRLVWVLPGKTKIVCHLKDATKIRIKKRWSQIMYMYYLLGYKIMERPDLSEESKQTRADNTFLLALDGDIDFQPDAVLRLVDRMKKGKTVGAACGRIHPTGSGYMPWYQKFEYAIGHWLQKATEHILGCVLCSPGCFSLFRGSALMDDNVMRKYATPPSKARHHVQYDQGEDRWLCTLMLQRGWRIEYSAASDSFTACPETFDGFYIQRRRWMPSTILNILDLLENWKTVTENNEDISWLYIVYQCGIMAGTIIGPGGIYMVLASAMSIVFHLDNVSSLIYNAIPLVLFGLACYFTEEKFQLAVAKILTLGYTIMMMVVYIGLIIQINEEGWLGPTAISAFSLFFPLIFAGLVHVQEAYCLMYMPFYLCTIPSMYILLVVFSLFNLWNVSWGTREGKKNEKERTMEEKMELEEIAKKDEERRKAGLLGVMKSGLSLGMDGRKTKPEEKGSVDFSLGNVLRCMCFTHEDPHDPSKQMERMADSMEKMASRLARIEVGSGPQSRRRSSTSLIRGRKSLTIDEENSIAEGINDEVTEESQTDEISQNQGEKRDPMVSPYWIEDPSLKNGPVKYLPGGEVKFWNEMIEQLLKPFKISLTEAADTRNNLYDYRDSFILGFLLINALYIVLVSMLQLNSPLKITWSMFQYQNLNGLDGIHYNFTYDAPENLESPEVIIYRETAKLDILGLVFLLTFSFITFCQLLGMMLHRWQTFCQYIATTKLQFFEKADAQDHNTEMMQDAVKLTREIQQPEKEEKKDKFVTGDARRRQTVANLQGYHKKVQREGQDLNLEKQFKKNLDQLDLSNPKDERMRKVSMAMRRDTVAFLQDRRQSVIERQMRRKSSVGFSRGTSLSSGRGSYDNHGYDEDGAATMYMGRSRRSSQSFHIDEDQESTL